MVIKQIIYNFTALAILVCLTNNGLCFVCSGTKNGISSLTRTKVEIYVKEYENCTIINNNVEVVFFAGNFSDTSFLDSIEEVKGYVLFMNNNFENITMKNLKIIRGNQLFENKSVFVEGNNNLKRTVFPSLKEIVKGNVVFESNPQLCFIDTISWKDIIYDNRKYSATITHTSPTCKKCECESCWSEDNCQEFKNKFCGPNCKTGCLKDEHNSCCHDECVVGCNDKVTNCIGCRHFNNSGTCVEACPSQTFYNSTAGKTMTNPDGKFHYQNECVDKCPNSTVQFQDSCVTNCPEKYFVSENICKECFQGSNCPKTCTASGFLTKENLNEFVNCSIFEGNFEILASLKVEDLLPHLNQFSTIEVITGFLVIQGLGEGIDDLSFFKNLRIIRGQRLNMAKNSAIQILNTNLKSLNIPHLERIENDRIVIFRNNRLEYLGLPSLKYIHGDADKSVTVKSNKELCYVTKETFSEITDPRKLVDVSVNKDENLCEQEKKVCHEECTGGCWGPGNKQCRSCKNFIFQGECLSSCNEYPNMYEDDNVCKQCDPQCKGGCYGDGPMECKECLNAKDDLMCLERCPVSKYLDPHSKTCQQCHIDCKNGCTGPLNALARGGCNDCHLLFSKSYECVNNKTFTCSFGFIKYEKINVHDSMGRENHNVVKICSECHPQCKSCKGAGASSQVCDCISVEFEGTCMKGCPIQYYQDAQNICHPCHLECETCSGSGADKCHLCKNVRVYINDYLNDTSNGNNTSNKSLEQEYSKITLIDHADDEQFICSATCPDHLPYYKHIVLNEDNGRKDVTQRVCSIDDVEDPSASKAKTTKILVGTLVFGGICLLLIFVIVLCVLRAQKAKSEENKARLQAKIEGLNTEEILSPTNAKPDLSCLRLIKENDLEKGEEIGSGAFGTVYRGIWHPEGEKVRVAVAIKVLTEESTSSQHKELLEEARVMASVSHPCCIRILAVCLTRQMMLITPLVAHGSLLSYLRKNGRNLSSLILLKWATQIARGMLYLEQKGIVHRDLAARNILVQGLNQVKITDFGLAKLLNIDEEQFLATGGKLPMKWLALESIQHRIFTHKSDVWSYGVTLWELFTYGQRPYENISAVDIADHLEMGERLPQPSICTIDVYMVMIKCWMIESDDRPTFRELEEIFCEMAKDPGRFLVIIGDTMSRMPSEVFEDNRTGVIRQMNLHDEEDLICGEDYLCPATPTDKNLFQTIEETSFENQEYFNQEPATKKGIQFSYLEAALHAGKMPPVDHYNAEPGKTELPRPPSLDETEIIKMEQAAKKANLKQEKNKKEDYLEPTPESRYVDMTTPLPDDQLRQSQPSFGQRGLLNNRSQGVEGVEVISYNKLKE